MSNPTSREMTAGITASVGWLVATVIVVLHTAESVVTGPDLLPVMFVGGIGGVISFFMFSGVMKFLKMMNEISTIAQQAKRNS